MNFTELSNGILAILNWSTHDFWRLIAVVMVLRALFSWRLIAVSVKTKNKANKDKPDEKASA